MFGSQQVSAFMNEHQQDKSDGEPPSSRHRVKPNGQDHGAACLEQQRGVLERGNQGKLEFGKQRDNGHTDRPQDLFHFLAEARLRRRRRRREAILRIFVLIHFRTLPEFASSRESKLDLNECLQ
jgi:hypothetical protein